MKIYNDYHDFLAFSQMKRPTLAPSLVTLQRHQNPIYFIGPLLIKLCFTMCYAAGGVSWRTTFYDISFRIPCRSLLRIQVFPKHATFAESPFLLNNESGTLPLQKKSKEVEERRVWAGWPPIAEEFYTTLVMALHPPFDFSSTLWMSSVLYLFCRILEM